MKNVTWVGSTVSQNAMKIQLHLEKPTEFICDVDTMIHVFLKTMFCQILRRMFKSPNHRSNPHPHRVTCHERGLRGAPMPPNQRNKIPPHPSVTRSTRQALCSATKTKSPPSQGGPSQGVGDLRIPRIHIR